MIELYIDVPEDSADDDHFMDQISGLMSVMMVKYPNKRVRVKVTLYQNRRGRGEIDW